MQTLRIKKLSNGDVVEHEVEGVSYKDYFFFHAEKVRMGMELKTAIKISHIPTGLSVTTLFFKTYEDAELFVDWVSKGKDFSSNNKLDYYCGKNIPKNFKILRKWEEKYKEKYFRIKR